MLIEAASSISASCPMLVDADTRLDGAVALANKTLQYNYTLVNDLKDSIDIDEFTTYVEANAIKLVKTTPDLRLMVDNDVTFIYFYRDKEGVFVTKVTITPAMYK